MAVDLTFLPPFGLLLDITEWRNASNKPKQICRGHFSPFISLCL